VREGRLRRLRRLSLFSEALDIDPFVEYVQCSKQIETTL
jgi:hypothetical protein